MNLKKYLPLYLLMLVLSACILCQCNGTDTISQKASSSAENKASERNGLDRTPTHIKYSRHARCRMGCRHITQEEIIDILKSGSINYRKSELNGDDCNKKYAVEGYYHNKQHLRVIFAPCADEITVVTCIDLGKEWSCDCG